MAIYQFAVTVIPRAGLLKRFGFVPGQLDTDDHTVVPCWRLAAIPYMPLIARIDQLADRPGDFGDPGFYSWKTLTWTLDNDAWMSIDTATGCIESLSFRADLRPQEQRFMAGMTAIASQHDWVFADRKGNVFPPELQAVEELIGISNAFRFLQDPETFLKGIGDGSISPE